MIAVQNPEYNDLRQFEGLTNYIDILMNEYPQPITRKELGQKIGVSQAAITKVKNRLLKLCDKNAFIFSSKLVLRGNETFWKLLVLYLLQMKPTKILLSRYGWHMIKQMDIHGKISQQFKEYATHFDEKDTECVVKIILFNLKNFQITDQIKTRIGDPQQRTMLLTFKYATEMGNIVRKLDLPMENTDDLIRLLTLRDKLFYLIKQLVWQQIQKARILQELSDTERDQYLMVYSKTADFYLRRLFEIGTGFIEQVAETRKLDFEESYKEIGYFYEYNQ